MYRTLGLVLLAVLLLASPVLAAEEGGHQGGLINLDKSLLIQAVNFVVLLFILWKLLYKPLVAKMNERTEAIKKSLEEAQAARAEAERQRQQHAAQIQASLAEAQQIRATALKEAADEQRRLVEAARAEAAKLVESAKAEMDQDIRRARQQLRQEVGDLAVQIAERLIKKSLRDEDHHRIIQEALTRVDRVN
ncbi:MAG TPA: F0F1 ATP synthase subunit B [Methylomirabilota bacterium]|nr:F0F1 ATP synthase subunit B [Methylomirabilota bacterium]